jgi:hypothetical protein
VRRPPIPIKSALITRQRHPAARSSTQGARRLAEVLPTGVIGTGPLLYLEALAFITRERRDAAACRATGRACFLGERSSIDLSEHDVERAEDRRDVGKHVPAA